MMSDKRGMLLTTAVILIAAVAVIVTGVFFLTNQQMATGLDHANGEEALYYAESGINRYLWFLNEDSNFYLTTEGIAMTTVPISFEGGFYQLSIVAPVAGDPKPKVVIRSTGWAATDPSRKRTIETAATKRAFVQNVFCTDVEKTSLNGSIVWWITGDVVNGPFHTNGNINIDGNPVFNGLVTYAGEMNPTPGSHPVYTGGGPTPVTKLDFPSTNTDLALWADRGGYKYQGRTSIYLQGSTITTLNSIRGLEVRSLPSNGVIYVDGTQGGQWDTATGNVFVSGTLDGRLTIAAANDIYITNKNPTEMHYDSAAVTGGIKYTNTTLSGANTSNDMLGLVAEGYVRILHYDWFGDTWWDRWDWSSERNNVAPTNITIYAAIFATNNSFEFDRHDEGTAKGTINFFGSITQKYRGAVGTFYSGSSQRATGYSKNYWHDPRMAYLSPPHFLEPLNAGWVLSGWHEIANP